jgi:hypothetical protein
MIFKWSIPNYFLFRESTKYECLYIIDIIKILYLYHFKKVKYYYLRSHI